MSTSSKILDPRGALTAAATAVGRRMATPGPPTAVIAADGAERFAPAMRAMRTPAAQVQSVLVIVTVTYVIGAHELPPRSR